VGLRDPERLQHIRGGLEEEIENTSNAASLLQLIDTLGHIVDPVAVPYLARVLESNKVKVEAVQGLGRIADRAAVDVLIAHRDWQDLQEIIQAILAGIAQTTGDRAIKERILESRH
jgi:HEAT repeat protein